MITKSIFEESVANDYIARIEKLTPDTKALWGKMSVAQMLSHVSLTLEGALGENQQKPPFLIKLLLAGMIRKKILAPGPYEQGSPTASYLIIKDKKDFNTEKQRLISAIKRYQQYGPEKAAQTKHSFLGSFTADEWSYMQIKHFDHHLSQFGV
jgi:hypothetical protein